LEINPDDFQKTVDELLIRHRSILDTLSKLQEANGKINRAVAKSVTCCGCLRISARRQEIPPDTGFLSWKNHTETHLDGELCERCREVLESEMGESLFYLAALCSLLHLDLGDIIEKENKRLTTLGLFNLT